MGVRSYISVNDIIQINAKIRNINGGGFRKTSISTISKDKTTVQKYCIPAEIDNLMEICVKKLNDDLSNLNSIDDLVRTISAFWFGFIITIHPFGDGNGRTGKAIVNKLLSSCGIKAINTDNPWQVKLTGDFNKDLNLIHTMFEYLITKQAIKSF